MKLQQSPEPGLCILTAFAMALNMPAEELLIRIGERWKILAFPDLPVPQCWRGIHIQELILVALERGFTVTPIELFPRGAPPQAINPKTRRVYRDVVIFHGDDEKANWAIFNDVIRTCSGVITGQISPKLTRYERGHAIAFEKGTIFDPSSDAFLYSMRQCETRNFYPNTAWRFDKMEKTNDKN